MEAGARLPLSRLMWDALRRPLTAGLCGGLLQCKGNMDTVMESIVHAVVGDDEPRFKEMITTMIADGEVPGYTAFTKETKSRRNSRAKKARKEAKEAEALKEEILAKRSKEAKGAGGAGAMDLFALIKGNQVGVAHR